jgi:rsbT antagonist protein RsbS
MAPDSRTGIGQPPRVSILSEGPYLIASVHTALDDSQLTRFQHDLVERIRRERSLGVIIDVGALDVVDSFSSRTLCNLATMAQLRGAQTVIVGISPELAITMVQLGMVLQPVHTALDLDEGLACLDRLTARGAGRATSPRLRGSRPW